MHRIAGRLHLNAETIRALTATDLRLAVGGLEKRTNTWPECGDCWPDPPALKAEVR